MVFNRKGSFFLNLDDQAPAEAAQVAPVRAPESKAKADKTSTPVAIAAAAAPAAAADPSPTTNTPAPTTGVTTAEAIAAELRAAQEARPAQTFITFAPERVSAGGALPMARRKGGANLAGFKAMAGSLFGK
ncbi:MAG: hypothetical protein JHD13_03200 [Synechococcales cyanobacterium SupBloom_Metag_052]|jgi:hypothetical protein|nr:hypothetical protein [Synechococcales cyanobacterium SupBloom_Metag_052]